MNQQPVNHAPDDPGLGIVIAGVLCILLAAYLCSGPRAAHLEPVATNGSATRCDQLLDCPTGWSCKKGRCAPPRRPVRQEGGNEGGGSDTHTSSGGGGRKERV